MAKTKAQSKMVKQWLTYAARDLRAAQALFEIGSDYKSLVAFSCQQSVEKAIKGYLVYHGVRPPKTHAIKELALAVESIDQELAKKLAKASKLTKFAVAYRYPDAEKSPLTAAQVKSALKLANQVLKIVMADILG